MWGAMNVMVWCNQSHKVVQTYREMVFRERIRPDARVYRTLIDSQLNDPARARKWYLEASTVNGMVRHLAESIIVLTHRLISLATCIVGITSFTQH